MEPLRASLIVPAKNEDKLINIFLNLVQEHVKYNVEILIVVDSVLDSTIKAIIPSKKSNIMIRPLVSSYGLGPANAIKFGINSANTKIVIVCMADGSDDPKNINKMIELVEKGYVIVAASRYIKGGQQIGAPWIKKILSRACSWILSHIFAVQIHDSTNSFKAYSVDYIHNVGIESSHGFEIGLELTVKAHRRGLSMSEIPTIWIERNLGKSNFRIWKWLPYYLKWFFYGLQPINKNKAS